VTKFTFNHFFSIAAVKENNFRPMVLLIDTVMDSILKLRLKIMTLSLCYLLLTACSKGAIDSLKITVADATQPVFALIYIAEHQGYFEDVGLTVKYLKFSSGRDALQSVIDDKADIATVYETPVVLQAFAKKRVKVISGLHISDKNTGLVVRTDRGIQKIEDLVGKKLGVPFNTNAHFFVNRLISNANINLNDIEWVNLNPSDAVAKFKSGDIDAVAVWNPNLYAAKIAFQADKIQTYYSDLYYELSMLVTLESELALYPEKYKRFLKAIILAKAFMEEYPLKGKEIVINHLENVIEPSILTAVWDDFLVSIELNNLMLNIFKQEAVWMKKQGVVEGEIPGFYNVIDTQLMNEVDPLSVTLIIQK